MGELVVQLLPLSLGVALSPLAILALVAVLVSRLPRANGVGFFLGWALGVVGVVCVATWIFTDLGVPSLGEPPLWSSFLRILLSGVLITSALYVYRKGAARIRALAASKTPEQVTRNAALPSWLQAVEHFRPIRSAALGFGVFALNPVDVSCAVIAALDVTLAGVSTFQATVTLGVFALIGVLPIGIPVAIVVVRGSSAEPMLTLLRAWISENTHVINAALLLVIGFLQLDKGVMNILQ